MSETTSREETKREKSAKRGLHGWKAALAVFGCGTLAAFGVFGVIVAVLSFFFGALSSGLNTPSGAVGDPGQAQGEPIEYLEPGELNLCEQDVQYSHGQSDPGYVSENYEDPALVGEFEERVVSDTCSWDIFPAGSSIVEAWDFSYSYEAVVSSVDGESGEIASRRFEELVSDPRVDGDILSEGDFSGVSSRSYYYYSKNSEGGYEYRLFGQTRGTVYVIKFISPEVNGVISEAHFGNEARSVAAMVEPALKVLVPD
ncbi:hypothetical protein ABZ620_20900 [Nocardiopsis alba]|uniref:hypothetical protein n=1 Tax=Nocardiopsis alba TaxID=53437 RepID=UPI0033F74219